MVGTWLQVAGHEIRSPLTYNTGFNFVEIDLADAPAGVGAGTALSMDSRMRLHKTQPAGYEMMKIVTSNADYQDGTLPWMALKPVSLSIAGEATPWPSGLTNPIAIIDTGGTQPFLSDPEGKAIKAMSDSTAGATPGWVYDAGTPSTSCSASSSMIRIELGDGTVSYAYSIDLTKLPAGEQATSLVVCSDCGYMFNQPGMNIGGLSMLFNSLLIDIASKSVGFMAKSPV